MKYTDPSSRSARDRRIPDTRKIVHRHLKNVNDVITEEDLKSVRISKALPVYIGSSSRSEEEADTHHEMTSWNVIDG